MPKTAPSSRAKNSTESVVLSPAKSVCVTIQKKHGGRETVRRARRHSKSALPMPHDSYISLCLPDKTPHTIAISPCVYLAVSISLCLPDKTPHTAPCINAQHARAGMCLCVWAAVDRVGVLSFVCACGALHCAATHTSRRRRMQTHKPVCESRKAGRTQYQTSSCR